MKVQSCIKEAFLDARKWPVLQCTYAFSKSYYGSREKIEMAKRKGAKHLYPPFQRCSSFVPSQTYFKFDQIYQNK